MGKRYIVKVCTLLIIPYISLLFIYISFYITFIGNTSDIAAYDSGQLIFWAENISTLLFGVFITLWLVLKNDLSIRWEQGICVFQMVCLIGFFATMYTSIFNNQMFLFIVNERGYILAWIGVTIVCLVRSFWKLKIKNQ